MTIVSPALILAAYLGDPASISDSNVIPDIAACATELPGLLKRNKVSLLPAYDSGL